jgi:uncharacterized protein YidB (DUF937 family)
MGILEDLLAGAMSGRGDVDDRGPERRAPARPPGGGMAELAIALLPVLLSVLSSRGGQTQRGGGSGGGLADILGQVLGGGAPRGGRAGDLGGPGDLGGLGGLGALLERLQQAGYGEQAQSWVGTGRNAPLPAEALEQILGRGGIGEIARRAGVSEADAARGLSELLPEVVDRVTPEGRLPEPDAVLARLSELSRRLGAGG